MLDYYLSVNNAEISHFRFHTRCSNCEKNKGLKTNKNRVRSGGKNDEQFSTVDYISQGKHQV